MWVGTKALEERINVKVTKIERRFMILGRLDLAFSSSLRIYFNFDT